MPQNAVPDLFFIVGRRGSPSSTRRRPAFPELEEATAATAVSRSPQPLSPRRRFLPLAPLTTAAEARRRRASSPTWLEPQWLEAKRTAVLNAAPGARRHHQLLLPCTVAPNPAPSELQPPPRARLRRARSTPAPPACPTRCARAPATRRTKPRPIWSTVGKSRALRRLGLHRRRAVDQVRRV